MMRRGEDCIDRIVRRATVHEDNKVSVLSSTCPASFPPSSHSLVPSSVFCPSRVSESLSPRLFWLAFRPSSVFVLFFSLFISIVAWLAPLPSE